MSENEVALLAAKMSVDHDTLTRIEEKLDTVIATYKERLDDHETRIRGMEKKQYALAGMAVVAGWLLQHLPFYARIG